MNLSFGLNIGSGSYSSKSQWFKEVLKNKCIEFATVQNKSSIFEFDLSVNARKCSHQGASLIVILMSFGFELTFYDKRHWDYEKDQWNEV